MASPNNSLAGEGMGDEVIEDPLFDLQQLYEGKSAFQLDARNDTLAPSLAAPAAVESSPPSAFWSAVKSFTLPSTGQVMTGPTGQLWNNVEELRPVIRGSWMAQQADTQGTVGEDDTVGGMNVEASGPGYQYPSLTDQLMTQAYPGVQELATQSSGNATLNGYQSPYPILEPSTSAMHVPQHLKKKRKRFDDTPVGSVVLPPYNRTADLADPSAAREYLSRFDPSDAFVLHVLGDDVGWVQSNLHTYAAGAYSALLHPYSPDPPEFDDRQKRYREQQESALMWLEKNLVTPAQIKTARACAILLIDAAIGVHTNGVSAARMEKHQHAQRRGLMTDASYCMSPNLTCSQRVQAMINAVKLNKLVAKDVLEQKSLVRFAECPDAYVARKFHYLRSNKTRQDKVEERAQVDQIMGIGERKKRGRRNAGPGVYEAKDAEVKIEDDGEYKL